MNAYSLSTKKRGRPFRFVSDSNKILNNKKQELFDNNECTSQHMSLVNLAYQVNKITKEEKDIASFLETLFIKVQKQLNIKKIPSSSPNTWNHNIKNTWQIIQHQDEKALNMWHSIKNHVEAYAPEIAQDFFKLICAHHSYEELLAIKLNFSVMDNLKLGLTILKSNFDDKFF